MNWKPSFGKFLFRPDNYVRHVVKMRNNVEYENSKCGIVTSLKNQILSTTALSTYSCCIIIPFFPLKEKRQ